MTPRIRAWLEETHGAEFELLRLFLNRGESGWTRVALGACALLPITWLMMWLAWQFKYLALLQRATPVPYRLAIRDDQLWLIALAMCATGALAALEWNALFPSRRDLLALASLPVSQAQIFWAKLLALALIFAAFALAITVVPAFTFVSISDGRWRENSLVVVNAAVLACAGISACAFVFFSMIGIQGVLFNLLPGRLFARVSVYVQAMLFTASTGALPFLGRQPAGKAWWPPQWFLNLWAAMIGARDGAAAADRCSCWPGSPDRRSPPWRRCERRSAR